MKPLAKEEEQDRFMLKDLTTQGIQHCLKCGIDLRGLLQPEQKKKTLNKKVSIFLSSVSSFLDTPYHKSVLYTLSYTLYILLFMYVIMTTNSEFARTFPSPTEWTLLFYWMAIFVDEFKQLSDERFQFQRYFASDWNKFDFLLFAYFILAIIPTRSITYLNCNITSLGSQKEGFEESDTFTNTSDTNASIIIQRGNISSNTPWQGFSESTSDVGCDGNSLWLVNIYSTYFVLWCLRFLQIFSVSQILGPKLIMIRSMILDMVKILVYISLISFSYSVWMMVIMRTTAPSFFKQTFDPRVEQIRNKTVNGTSLEFINGPFSVIEYIKTIDEISVILFLDELFSHPVWHLFGETYDDDFSEDIESNAELHQHYKYFITKFLGPLIRFIYMLIAVILLLNLLIAIFAYSIKSVTEKSKQYWNVKRTSLIIEYCNKSKIPIPFCLFVDVLYLLPMNVIYLISKYFQSRIDIDQDDHSFGFDCNPYTFHVNRNLDQNHFISKWLSFVSKWEKGIQIKMEEEIAQKC
jgi:hypothetical protein